MWRKISEWWSVRAAKNPRRMVLLAIALFNLALLILAAFIFSSFKLPGTEEMNFAEAIYYSITMLLDAGCISFVVEEVSAANAVIAAICIIFILLGMVSFTGTIIGYVTNSISNYVESASSGDRPLFISNHVVILNWNTRASEIVNDLLYSSHREKVVILTSDGRKDEIEKEIAERIAVTLEKENQDLRDKCNKMGYFQGRINYARKKMTNQLTIIVREGDVYSIKQLKDISLLLAKTVIILGNDVNNTACKFEQNERVSGKTKGNSQTIKTLMQVADMTASKESADNQKIIVEITDDWTNELVHKIIKCKMVEGKCNIVPVRVNYVLGQILSQFALMPELNMAYRDLFSNKGMTFYAQPSDKNEKDEIFIKTYLSDHVSAIPLTHMVSKGRQYAFFAAGTEADLDKTGTVPRDKGYQVKLNKNYWIDEKMVLILGHNSKCKDIMEGFCSFYQEWNYETILKDGEKVKVNKDILNVVVIDDEKNLEKMNRYLEYPFVKRCISAEIYDKELISKTIDECLTGRTGDVSILILSDDNALNEDIDANALANLVYVQEIIMDKKAADPDFDVESLDVIVEIIDPKHHDIVNSYSANVEQYNDNGEKINTVNNVVISNRYISKMITQIGEKDVLYDFYRDILAYDEGDSGGYDSKEIYAKKVSQYFDEIPARTTVAEFVRALYEATTDPSIPSDKQCPAIALGYVKPGGRMTLFEGNQREQMVELGPNDKIILYSNH